MQVRNLAIVPWVSYSPNGIQQYGHQIGVLYFRPNQFEKGKVHHITSGNWRSMDVRAQATLHRYTNTSKATSHWNARPFKVVSQMDR